MLVSAALCLLATSALSQQNENADATALWKSLSTRDFATDVDADQAIRAFVGHGEKAIAVLAAALPEAREDDEFIDITYFTAIILSQGRVPGGSPVSLSLQMIGQLAALFGRSDNQQLRANLVNIAGMLGPDAAPMIDGLMTTLRNASDPGMRASTQYALGAVGGAILPVLYAELRHGKDERLLGDITQILRGSTLPDDIVTRIEALLQSGNAEVREQAIKALRDLGIDSRRLSQAAAANLATAETDQKHLMAASKLVALKGPADIDVPALDDALVAFDDTRRSSERVEIARYLALAGPRGLTALAKTTKAARSQEERSDLVFALGIFAAAEPAVIEALIVSAFHSDDERTRQSAMMGLIRVGDPAVPAIEDAMNRWPDPDYRRHLEMALAAIRAAGRSDTPNETGK
ncbi:hypothetical protein G6N74_30065 [Mesorhizobium sp. CGMCC 1.15528]|uniref:HEAT repeat domain-containing protein n=2 Tax=Mesorhizobium zhangyense TaxID=1776730 RepID=A0A7C9RBY1_9HYPH|nr:hypothetical protein [Mesorhizobium zhangyense]